MRAKHEASYIEYILQRNLTVLFLTFDCFFFLLMTVINGEKATFNTPIFAQKRERTLDMLIKDLCAEHMGDGCRAVSSVSIPAFNVLTSRTPDIVLSFSC